MKDSPLKIDTQPRDDHQVRMVTEIEPELLERKKHSAAREIATRQKIPGFRPGKAPYDIVRRQVGEEAIEEKAIDMLLDEVYPQALDQSGIKPFGPGTLEEIVSKDPLTFAFVVPLAPEVDLKDYTTVKLEFTPPVVDDTQVDSFIERMRASYATMSPVDRPAGPGDVVFLTLEGSTIVPGGEPEVLVASRPMEVTIPKEGEEPSPGEWPFPGFAARATGLKSGEEKTFNYTFTDDSPYESLKGKQAEYHIQVTSVKESELPELNEDFAQQAAGADSIDKLRELVRVSLEEQAVNEYEGAYFNDVVNKILDQASVKFPPQAVDEEIHQLLHNVEADLARQKMDLPAYLKLRKLEEKDFIETEIRPAAIRRLERSLVLDQLAKAEDIRLDENLYQNQYYRTISELQGQVDMEALQKKKNSRMANAIAMEALNRTMNRQLLARLKKIASGIEEPVPTLQEPAVGPGNQVEVAQVDTDVQPAAEPAEEAPEKE